jgi:TP901 family phage tail tape measure protein
MATSLATLGVRINATEALIGLKRLDHRLKGVGLSSSQVGAKLVKFGKIAGAALGGLAIMSIKTAANFESSMNKVSAIGGHTGKALLDLENQARDLGKSTVFSASEAADGMTFLAMAGFDAQQTMAAMPAVLDLAAASSTDLATSADIASNILSGLGLGANKTGKLVDVMAKATSSANMNVIELGEAMKMSSPLAKTAGLTMEGMTAILGKMADAGIKGSLAGTALKAGIAKLLKPTAEMTEMLDGMGVSINNTDGSMRNFIDILQDLEQSGAGATEFVTIFGQRAGPQLMAALTQGVDGIKGLRTELQNAGGTAKKMADTQLKGLNGALKKLNSAWEELQIKFAKTGVLTALTEKVDELTEALGKKETIERIKAFGRGVLSVGSAMKTVFDAFMALPAWIREVGVVLAFLGGKKAKLVLAGITALSWGIGKIGDAIASVGDEAESAIPKLEKFSAFQKFPSIKPFIKDDTPIKKPKSMGLSDEDTVLAKRLNSARQTIKTVGEYKDSIAELGVEMTAQARVGKEFEKHKEDVIATMKAAGQSETFQTSQIEAMTSAYEAAIVRMEELDIANKVKALTDSMADSITGMIMNIGNGANSLKDTVKDMARVVLAEFIKIKVAQPLANSMASNFNFASMFREHGGTVTGNKPYIVGEAGAEIFLPNKTGTIIPNDALSQGGGGETNVSVSFNITANDTTGFDDLLDSRRGMIVGIINQAMNDRGMTGVTA